MADLTVDDLTQPHIVFQFGIAPARVDVLTTIDAVSFPEAWKNRVETHLSGIPISIISLQDLIRNKEAASRDTDRLHLKRLRKYGK
jgi:predicted nucleotidyltransferase